METPLKQAKILFADDDESFRPALQKILEKMGHAVTVARDGAEAKGALLLDSFDLVISDIRMPEVDGIELTKFIKGGEKPVPVILVTGFSDILETKQAHELGADEFLPKPIDREGLSKAIQRCLSRKDPSSGVQEDGDVFCKVGIDDFICGRQILFNIFVQLSETKYIKVAHCGEDLSIDRIRSYKEKGVHYLHLRGQDFGTYVGFNLKLAKAIRGNKSFTREKKLTLLKHTGEVIQEHVKHQGVNEEVFESASSFVQTAVEIVCEDPEVMELLGILNSHTDYLYAHSVGVSVYSVMLARAVAWDLPTNRFKVAMGGLFHDIGEKEIPRDLLLRPRVHWSTQEVQVYETHPDRGVNILGQVSAFSDDVIQIVKEHHENCLGLGFPSHKKKATIHPMARLVSVANEFCDRVIQGADGPAASPQEALKEMETLSSDHLDVQFFTALVNLFKPPKPESKNLGRIPR